MKMRVLVAESEPGGGASLEAALAGWGYEVLTAPDGAQAWEQLQRPDGPRLAILAWELPGLDGAEVCRRARALADPEPLYLLLLLSPARPCLRLDGLRSGANDCLVRPFDPDELAARLTTASAVAQRQRQTAERVRELERALARAWAPPAALPICSWCQKIRDEQQKWLSPETYFRRAGVPFTHGICPECYEKQSALLEDWPDMPPVDDGTR
jgi:CheY-like chemotaxis protein